MGGRDRGTRREGRREGPRDESEARENDDDANGGPVVVRCRGERCPGASRRGREVVLARESEVSRIRTVGRSAHREDVRRAIASRVSYALRAAVRVAARSEEGDSAPSEPTSDSGEKNCSRISFDSSQSFPPRSRGFRTGIRRGHTEGARDAEAPSGTRSSPRSCTAVVRPGTVPRPRSARAAARPGKPRGRWNKFTSPTPTERARRVLGRAPGFRRRRRQHLLQRGGSD